MSLDATRRLCALSVDIDPLTAYYTIHGLGEPPRQVRHTIARKALPRFEELFAELEVPVTFFVVGQDLEQSDEARALFKRLAQAGHEIANHTYSHPYALCRLSRQAVAEEITRAHRAITEALGEEFAPVGFRSPGYFINRTVLEVLTEQGYLYDSSMFPSPPYYLAKAAVMLGLALRGRRSGAVLSDPRGLIAPAEPYHPDPQRTWCHGDSPILELPVAVLPRTRLPVIGTTLAVGPRSWRRRALEQMGQRTLFNLELHGIDLSDAVADRIPTELAGRQPDLRIPFHEKRAILKSCIEELKREREFVTLRQAAQLLT